MPSVSEAVMIDVWRLFRDGILRGGFTATYTNSDININVKRHVNKLIITIGDYEEEITLWNANEYNSSPAIMEVMLCPECIRTCLQLYYYNCKIACKSCHKLDVDTDAKIARKQRFLDNAKAFLTKYEADRAAGIPARRSVLLGEATRPAHLTARIARLERQIAALRLKQWRGVPNA
jgi:hypothetical protein